MNRPRIRRVAPIAVVALLTLAACGDDDDDADTTTETTETTETTAGTETTEGTETTGPSRRTDATDDTDDTDDTEDTEDTASTEPTGTGSETAAEDDYVAAAAEAIGFADADISECLARELVEGIGMERIEASGLSPEEFVDAESLAEIDLAVEAADAPDVAAAMADCGDLVEAYLESAGVTDEEAECARPEMTSELFAEWLVAGISELPTSPEVDAMVEALQACDTD